MCTTKSGLLISGILLAVLAGSVAKATGRDASPLVFFDLGGVIVDTADFDNLRYMPGAEMYIYSLQKRGVKMGLITNVPEKWGRNERERVQALKVIIAKAWREPRPFPWQFFEPIIVPMHDRYQKPHPAMFIQAMGHAGVCRPIYQGESQDEITTAREVGFLPYLTGRRNYPTFLPIQAIRCRERAR